MSTIFGAINLADTDRVFSGGVDQKEIYAAAVEWINAQNAAVDAALSVFVEQDTAAYSIRYKLPGSGYLQERNEMGRPALVKAGGYWDVAFPLRDFGAGVGWNDVARAYMTAAELDRHIQTVYNQNVNTIRFEMLKALFKNTTTTFVDPVNGSLTVQPLANGDAVVYPPVLGSLSEATDDHYLESNYLYTAISDVNNPYATMSAELEEHFGSPTGGAEIAVFQPASVSPYTRALTDFVPVGDMGVVYGSDSDTAGPIPPELSRIGRVLGRMEGSGVWVVEWRYMPTAATPYLLGIHLGAPKPLIRRVDPADTGLGTGLQLVAEDEEYPFTQMYWRNRFGFGVGNRLNGVVMELAAGGTYTIPTVYA